MVCGMDDPVLDLPLSTYPHPSSAYVRWYYRCRLHNLLAASVPRPVYLAVREWFDDVVRSRLDRPPVMAYDSKPVSLSRALGLFEYETTDRIVQLVRTRRTRVAVAALKALGRAAKIAEKCAD